MTLLQPDDAYFELGNAPLTVIALGLRRGAFKHHVDVQSLIAGREYHIQWRDELLDMPFFVASGPRGMSNRHDTPMTADGARTFLQRTAIEAGLGGKCLFACE
jgi:hypothetical protein